MEISNLEQAKEWALADLHKYQGSHARTLSLAMDHVLGYATDLMDTTPAGNWLEGIQSRMVENGVDEEVAQKTASSSADAFRQCAVTLLTTIRDNMVTLPLEFLLDLREPFPSNGIKFQAACSRVSEPAGVLASEIIGNLPGAIRLAAVRGKTHFETAVAEGRFRDPNEVSVRSYECACKEAGETPDEDLVKRGQREAAHRAIGVLVRRPLARQDFRDHVVRSPYQRPKLYGVSTETDYEDVKDGVYCEPYQELLRLLSYCVEAAADENSMPSINLPPSLTGDIHDFMGKMKGMLQEMFPSSKPMEILKIKNGPRDPGGVHIALRFFLVKH